MVRSSESFLARCASPVSINVRRPVSVISALLCVLTGVLAFGGAPALAASKGVVGVFGGTGTAGGLFNAPGGVAVNDTSGDVYVVDSGNNRVQEFGGGGAFIRAWGLGVVSTGQDSGGTSTIEKVTINGTSGTFTLSLSGDTTGAIAYGALSGSVEAALDALPVIGGVGGSVTVTGAGTGLNPYEVTFGGSLQGGAVAQMTVGTSGLGVAVGTSLSCVAGPSLNAPTKAFQWLRNGVAITGATSSSYTTVAGDEGDVVQCQVFAFNADAGSTQVSAAAVLVSPALVTAAPPVAPVKIEKPVVMSGSLTLGGAGGARLSCEPGAWTGASSFAYQWYRNGVALSGDGGDTSVYTVQSADLASAAVFQCAVTGSDAGGSVMLVSANLDEPRPTAPVAPGAMATATIPVLATVATTVTGAPAFEVCNAISSPQDVCKAGLAESSAAGAIAGAMSAPQGVAVAQATGDVYMTDQGNRRVDEFTEAGVFVRAFGREVNKATKGPVCEAGEECQAGVSGGAAGEFGTSLGYPAVDPVTGDVYVADPANRRVQVFEADGVFKQAFGWGVANGAGEFQVCTSTCQAGVANASEPDLGGFAAGSPSGVVLDAQGDVYVVDGGAPDFRVEKFASVSKGNAPLAESFVPAQLTGSSSATAPSDIAVEPASGGKVFVAREPSSPAEHLVYELSTGGLLSGTYAEGAALPSPQGLAVGSSSESVYFSTTAGNRVFVLGTTVAPAVTVEAATSPTASEATLHGTVNPNETPPNGLETAWQFEYSTNGVEWTALPAGRVAASKTPVAVTQTVTGLEGGTVYDVRLHASKEFAAGSATSATVQFTTTASAPVVSGEAVTKIASTSAVLSAQINPQHLDTTYHFEYDTTPYTTSAMHGTSLPQPDADIGAGVSDVAVDQEPQDLKPGTTYHYRVVATSSVGATDGPEHLFTTQGTGSAFVLPDGRAWEMVSPPDRNGAVPGFIGGEEKGSVIQAAADGGAFTWTINGALGSEPAGDIAFNWSQIFSVRDAGGWSSRDIAPPHDAPSGLGVPKGTEYKFFSTDLSLGLVEPINVPQSGNTPLAPEATERTLYLRDDEGSTYLPLVTPASIPPGTKIDERPEPGEEKSGLGFAGATPDLSHVLIYGSQGDPAPPGLDPEYPGVGGTYEWSGGRLQLVGVLPDGEPETGHTSGRHAISNDGSRVVWSGSGGLYLRDMVKEETVLLGDGTFQTASDDDHRVFFTSGSDLDVFETINGEDEQLKGELTDLTVDLNAGESAGVEGLLPGASEDGSYVYVVATGVLSEAANPEHEKAVPGANNLYVLHDTGAGWTTAFIAQLSGEDARDWNSNAKGLEWLTSRVSPDGRYLAFMSDRELTGYDDHDANSGVADEEVFLYHAPENLGSEPGGLVCASCDPTGARPVGVFDEGPPAPATGVHVELAIDGPKAWYQRWLAGNIPGWDSTGQGVEGGVDEAFYQSRYLSDDGRLFFNSSDALVPLDVNGQEDVYEYEPEGDGPENARCRPAAGSGSVVFKSARTVEVEGREDEEGAGCVGLISSGSSSKESAFLDASENGGEVFFLTAAKLSPRDTDTSMDVYDAHECTSQVPCVSPPGVSPECATADACRAAPTPQPPIFGAPSSATFSGAGNPAPAPAPAPTAAAAEAKVKVLTRAQKLAEALKQCKKKESKKQRSACEKQARKRYGALKAKKRTSKGGK